MSKSKSKIQPTATEPRPKATPKITAPEPKITEKMRTLAIKIPNSKHEAFYKAIGGKGKATGNLIAFIDHLIAQNN